MSEADAYIQSKEMIVIGKNMSQNRTSEREAIAIAACDISGLERPLSAGVPKASRRYLYAYPSSDGGKFDCDELGRALRVAGAQHGVDWDARSDTFGLRYVVAGTSLSADIQRFASAEAKEGWEAWRKDEAEAARSLLDAAAVVLAGRDIDFSSEDEATPVKIIRRRNRHDERE